METFTEVLKEESSKVRCVATIEIYTYGNTEEDCIAEAKQIVKELDDKYDNKANLVKVQTMNFGQIGVGDTVYK